MAVVAFAAGWWLAGWNRVGAPRSPSRPATGQPRTVPTPRAAQTPTRAQTPAPVSSPTPAPAASPAIESGPRVAIIFDDAGGSLSDVEHIIAIGRPVAVAVLPHLTHSAGVARRARDAGLEVLLHLPVEPEDATKAMGPGGVTVAMTDGEIRAVVRADLETVPGAIGVNNHMGSKGTADRRVVRIILETVRDSGLFFLDSVTTPHSVVPSVSEEVGVRTAARAVFLDNENEEAAIRQQLQRLITVAKGRGNAIAIGHAQRLTSRVVAAMLPEFDRAGVTLVPVSTLVK